MRRPNHFTSPRQHYRHRQLLPTGVIMCRNGLFGISFKLNAMVEDVSENFRMLLDEGQTHARARPRDSAGL
jgi:hypothetical protein